MEATIWQRGTAFQVRARQLEGFVSLTIDENVHGSSPNNSVTFIADNPEVLIALGVEIANLGRELRAVSQQALEELV